MKFVGAKSAAKVLCVRELAVYFPFQHF